MFQFTTTTILNSNKDSSGKAKWSAEAGKSFYVKRVNNFITDNSNIKINAYKRLAANPKLAKSTIVLDNYGEGVYLLVVQIKYLGSQNSFYATPTSYVKGKPLFYSFELTGTETSAQVAEKIVKIVKYLLDRYGDKWINVTNSSNTLNIEAIDEYQRFATVSIQEFQPLDNACHCASDCQCGWVTIVNALPADSSGVFPNPNATIVQGREGFGTFTQIMKDLRLPTATNTNWTAINQEERPIPGELYNEYVLEYTKPRGVMGQSAVGMQATSSTVHVFYVKQSIASDFEAALSSSGIVITNVTKPSGYPN